MVLAGCTSGRPAPELSVPVAADTALAVDTAALDAVAADSTADAAADLEERLVALARATRGPEATEAPIKPAGVSWSPVPTEGSAVGITLHVRPSARPPLSVRGEFAGREVRFGLLGNRWFGVAAVPIGTAGPATLTLYLEYANGPAAEQTVEVNISSTSFPSTRLSVDPRFSSPPPEVLERIRRERELVREVLGTVTPKWLIKGRFGLPRPLDVTSPFGQARTFNGELRSRHTGLDLRGSAGAPVRASAAGEVAFAGNLYFAGNAIYVNHGLGVYTGYFHLSRMLVEPGDQIEAGQLIGEVGATGRVTAAHLHWYLAVAGQSVDAGSLLEMEGPPDPEDAP